MKEPKPPSVGDTILILRSGVMADAAGETTTIELVNAENRAVRVQLPDVGEFWLTSVEYRVLKRASN